MAGAIGVRTAKLSLLLAVTAVVCLAQYRPPEAASWGAKAVSVEGQVSVLRDSRPWAISTGEGTQVYETVVTGADGHAVFQVADCSTCEVYPNSRVIFRAVPFDWRDLLDVIVGRIRVHIEHLTTAPN